MYKKNSFIEPIRPLHISSSIVQISPKNVEAGDNRWNSILDDIDYDWNDSATCESNVRLFSRLLIESFIPIKSECINDFHFIRSRKYANSPIHGSPSIDVTC